MKIDNVEILVTAIAEKENASTRALYWPLSFVTLDGEGTAITINVKDKELIEQFEVMNRYCVNLSLASSQYGLKLDFGYVPIVKKLGVINFTNSSALKVEK